MSRSKGLHGSPTYDTLGFELDKEYVIRHTGGRPRPLGKLALDRLDQKRKDSDKKAEIIGIVGDDNKVHEEAWDDRVARDLSIAFHELGVGENQEWQRSGFKAKKEEFDSSEKERDRLMDFMGGSALRKGVSIAKVQQRSALRECRRKCSSEYHLLLSVPHSMLG